jgi:hypothetical protein
MAERPPAAIARSLSGLRRFVGYGGRFQGCQPIVP